MHHSITAPHTTTIATPGFKLFDGDGLFDQSLQSDNTPDSRDLVWDPVRKKWVRPATNKGNVSALV